MSYLRASEVAKSGGCPRRINAIKRVGQPSQKIPDSSYEKMSVPQRTGEAAHRIAQEFFSNSAGDEKKRNESYNSLVYELDIVKNEKKIPEPLEEIIGEDFVKNALHDKSLGKMERESRDLLDVCKKFLEFIERNVPEEFPEIEVHIEKNLTEICPEVTRHVFGEDMQVSGSVDVVLHVPKKMYILIELKTGEKTKSNEKQWRRQLEIYQDIWKESLKNKERLLGFVLHKSLDRGRMHVEEYNWAEQLTDPNATIPGRHCDYCEEKRVCPDSQYDPAEFIR